MQFEPWVLSCQILAQRQKALATSAPPAPKQLRRSLIRSPILFYKVVVAILRLLTFSVSRSFSVNRLFFREALQNPPLHALKLQPLQLPITSSRTQYALDGQKTLFYFLDNVSDIINKRSPTT